MHSWYVAVVFIAVFLSLQCVDHLGHQIVNVEKVQLIFTVADCDGQIVSDIMAECGHSTVVVWAAPFAEQVRKTVD